MKAIIITMIIFTFPQLSFSQLTFRAQVTDKCGKPIGFAVVLFSNGQKKETRSDGILDIKLDRPAETEITLVINPTEIYKRYSQRIKLEHSYDRERFLIVLETKKPCFPANRTTPRKIRVTGIVVSENITISDYVIKTHVMQPIPVTSSKDHESVLTHTWTCGPLEKIVSARYVCSDAGSKGGMNADVPCCAFLFRLNRNQRFNKYDDDYGTDYVISDDSKTITLFRRYDGDRWGCHGVSLTYTINYQSTVQKTELLWHPKFTFGTNLSKTFVLNEYNIDNNFIATIHLSNGQQAIISKLHPENEYVKAVLVGKLENNPIIEFKLKK